MKINPIQQTQNYNQKIIPSFTALNRINYGRAFCPLSKREHALKVKAFLENPAFKNFCEKFDVEANFNYFPVGHCLALYFKQKFEKPKNLFAKCIDIFREDRRTEYRISFNLEERDISKISQDTIDYEVRKEMTRYKYCKNL